MIKPLKLLPNANDDKANLNHLVNLMLEEYNPKRPINLMWMVATKAQQENMQRLGIELYYDQRYTAFSVIGMLYADVITYVRNTAKQKNYYLDVTGAIL